MILVRWLKACCIWNNVASYIVIWQLATFLSMINTRSRLETLVSPGTITFNLELTTLVMTLRLLFNLIFNPSLCTFILCLCVLCCFVRNKLMTKMITIAA